MCRAVRCKVCSKTTWAGCGKHVEAVRAKVPAQDWCPGHDGRSATTAPGAPAGRPSSFFGRLFGR